MTAMMKMVKDKKSEAAIKGQRTKEMNQHRRHQLDIRRAQIAVENKKMGLEKAAETFDVTEQEIVDHLWTQIPEPLLAELEEHE